MSKLSVTALHAPGQFVLEGVTRWQRICVTCERAVETPQLERVCPDCGARFLGPRFPYLTDAEHRDVMEQMELLSLRRLNPSELALWQAIDGRRMTYAELTAATGIRRGTLMVYVSKMKADRFPIRTDALAKSARRSVRGRTLVWRVDRPPRTSNGGATIP